MSDALEPTLPESGSSIGAGVGSGTVGVTPPFPSQVSHVESFGTDYATRSVITTSGTVSAATAAEGAGQLYTVTGTTSILTAQLIIDPVVIAPCQTVLARFRAYHELDVAAIIGLCSVTTTPHTLVASGVWLSLSDGSTDLALVEASGAASTGDYTTNSAIGTVEAGTWHEYVLELHTSAHSASRVAVYRDGARLGYYALTSNLVGKRLVPTLSYKGKSGGADVALTSVATVTTQEQ